MAYSTSNQPRLVSQSIAGVRLWEYTDGDAIAAVDATDYFTDASDLGMETGDVLFLYDTTNDLTTIGQITVDADGNGTLTALTAVP